ncbi:MAG: hypothetical protein SPF89_07640 [Sphaerochaetaceae bacterium]|nr:hypothetical protein [Spirochaetales bacterium]MDY5499959.1 hypothetical protein [Sphaerochaetaceae bacterium]
MKRVGFSIRRPWGWEPALTEEEKAETARKKSERPKMPWDDIKLPPKKYTAKTPSASKGWIKLQENVAGRWNLFAKKAEDNIVYVRLVSRMPRVYKAAFNLLWSVTEEKWLESRDLPIIRKYGLKQLCEIEKIFFADPTGGIA